MPHPVRGARIRRSSRVLCCPAVETLSDLVFEIRDSWSGRADLLAIRRHGRVEQVSTAELVTAVHGLALALEERGVERGERVALWAENCPEWHVVDLACHLLGAIPVPIYPTLAAPAVAYILKNSGASWVFYSDHEKAAALARVAGSLSRELHTVALEHEARGDGDSLMLLQADGVARIGSRPLERFRGRVSARDTASIIYTSGTTGDPKGVVLSHGNFVSNVLACEPLFPLGPTDRALSFLPLSHVFERTVDYLFLRRGVAIHYAPSIERVPPLLLEVRPSVLASVPRLYERAYLRALANVAKETPFRQRLFRWALRAGKRYAAARARGRLVSPWLALERAIAARLVYSKIRARFGGRLRFAIAGGAALGEQVAEFFEAVGIPLYEGYGLTESSPVLAANCPEASRRGSVGRPIPGVEIRIADDGEILARGPGVMQGYWGNEEATREAVDDEGWLHTGDIGRIDADGFLFITDRKKDLLITSGGKNVAPQPIEQLLTAQPAIAQAVVVGDNYPYLTALIAPSFEDLPPELAGRSQEALLADPAFERRVDAAIDAVNAELSEHERIRNWQFLPRELSQAEGEVTPTLKVRRRIVLERYRDLVASMYLKTQKVPYA
jgi:long-chain acyl-CoA synthetase